MRSNRRVAAGAVAAVVLVAFFVCAEAGGANTVLSRGSAVASPRGERIALHAKPGSRRLLATVAATTRFGSPTVLAVVGERRGWLAVISAALGNGVYGWVRADSGSLRHDAFSVEVDLSQRRLTVWRAGVRERRFAVAVGSPLSATPSGRFSITDKLAGFDSAACWPSQGIRRIYRPAGTAATGSRFTEAPASAQPSRTAACTPR
jgi:hypothetical protein